jgi:hypothetical protein
VARSGTRNEFQLRQGSSEQIPWLEESDSAGQKVRIALQSPFYPAIVKPIQASCHCALTSDWHAKI